MKRVLTLFVITFVAAGCGNGSLLAPSPSESGETGNLNLSAVHHLHDGSALTSDESGAKTIVNDLGFQITLTHASVGYRNLSLVSSGDDPECVGGNDTTVAINGSDDLLGEDLVETSLGAHAIPLASFCSYTLTLGPSEEEGAALTDPNSKQLEGRISIEQRFRNGLLNKFHAGEDHEAGEGGVHGAHATLHLQGTWSKDGGPETEFEIELEETVEVTGVFEHPLHFHEGETETAKVFGVKYDVLFDGIDFETNTIDAQYSKAAENLAHAAHIHGAGSGSH